MKSLLLMLFLSFGLLVGKTQTPSQLQRSASTSTQDNAGQVQLSTSIVTEQYAVEGGVLLLDLDLSYSNVGSVPVLVDKKSSWVYRILVSRNLKKALSKKYDYDEQLLYADVRSMRAAGMHMGGEEPEREAFVMLKPGEAHSVRQQISLLLYDGTKETRDRLHPGDYYLQLKVATWYYFADPEVYQEKWKDDGYVWARNVTSEPMAFRIRKVS